MLDFGIVGGSGLRGRGCAHPRPYPHAILDTRVMREADKMSILFGLHEQAGLEDVAVVH